MTMRTGSGARRFRRLARRMTGDRRRAATIVEFAVVLPLLLTVLFGIMEYGWMFMVRQGLMNAAREGCRVAVLSTSSESDIVERVNEVVAPLGLTVTIEMEHATIEKPVESVVVRVPAADVSLMGEFFGARDYDLTGSCSMRKEGMGDAEE